ncbi:Adenosylhopane nucleosidase, HpnG [Candidatus Paraburkholderia kirkii]|nr:Adenosylhopane nucleosidase, HpnG [Candidatus Paraburkholderia kirkii]
MDVVFAARADWLERALSDAIARGCSGIVSFGTAGGLAPDLAPGALIVAESVSGPFDELRTDAAWSARIVDAFAGTPVERVTRRGRMAGVTAPVKSEAEKRSLHRSTGALAVDMESHIATARGLPFAVCRAVVDPAWRTLPPAATAGLRDDGTTAIGPILREPAQLGALLRLARDARATLVQARHALETARALAFD